MTLSEYLAQPGVTALALGRKIGVVHTTILRWAQGEVPADKLAALCAETGLNPAHVRPDLAAMFAVHSAHTVGCSTNHASGIATVGEQ